LLHLLEGFRPVETLRVARDSPKGEPENAETQTRFRADWRSWFEPARYSADASIEDLDPDTGTGRAPAEDEHLVQPPTRTKRGMPKSSSTTDRK
jgi:hypothetical protein